MLYLLAHAIQQNNAVNGHEKRMVTAMVIQHRLE